MLYLGIGVSVPTVPLPPMTTWTQLKGESFFCIQNWLTQLTTTSNRTTLSTIGCNRCGAAGGAWKLLSVLKNEDANRQARERLWCLTGRPVCSSRVALFNPFSDQAGAGDGPRSASAAVLEKKILVVTREGYFWGPFAIRRSVS